MRKIAILDVDDVILNFIGGVNTYVSGLNKGFVINPEYIPKSWGWRELGDIGNEINTFINNMSDDLSCFDNTVNFINSLKEMDFEIILMTAHPAHLTLERIQNLKKNNIEFDSIYCTFGYGPGGEKISHPKSSFIKELTSPEDKIIFVDDKATTVIDVVHKIPNAIGFTMDRASNDEALGNIELFDKDANRFYKAGTGIDILTAQVDFLYNEVLEKAKEI